MRTWFLSAGMVAALGSSGCVGASLVAAHAAEDLGCPEAKITVTSREFSGYEARGCGKHASYVVRAGEVMQDSGHEELPAEMPRGGD